MPAEEHGEPVGVLRQRGERRGGAGRDRAEARGRAEGRTQGRAKDRNKGRARRRLRRQGSGRACCRTKGGERRKKPSQAQISAISSDCRSDYPKVCAGVPTGGAAALECLEKNKAKVSAACAKAVAAVGGGGGAPAAAAGGGSTAVHRRMPRRRRLRRRVIVLRPMLPREELFVLRSACGGDVRALCAGVPAGGGRIIECLASQAAALSPACRDVLGSSPRNEC